jgi:hypothetical protein
MTLTAITNELMYEVQNSIQAPVAVIREDMDSIKSRLTSLDARLGVVHTDMAPLRIGWTGSKAGWGAWKTA